MSDWQPIETIPTRAEEHHWERGERVLVWVADGGDKRTGVCEFGYGYTDSNGTPHANAIGYNGDWKITAWAPLPHPPSLDRPASQEPASGRGA